jgi:hypothetical protein
VKRALLLPIPFRCIQRGLGECHQKSHPTPVGRLSRELGGVGGVALIFPTLCVSRALFLDACVWSTSGFKGAIARRECSPPITLAVFIPAHEPPPVCVLEKSLAVPKIIKIITVELAPVGIVHGPPPLP